ncbi:MAG TPA: isoprenylcysteine carboxylmethyltransferase family protein [Opitutaceae bacterium]|nr:isoprenylcysteine carboxylmethyltransferase family protein [Opitutaceae bacterium]
MTKPMTRWGVGPLWALISLLYGIAANHITQLSPALRIPDTLYPALTYLGIFLIVLGLPYYFLSARAVMRAFSAGELVTKGVYGLCRHPLYGSWIVFIVPGIELLLHSWFGLTTSLAMYAALRVLAKREEECLVEKFGDRYLQYKARVPFVLPVGWLK